MKKTVFKSTLCAVLAIFMLFSLTSCGESKMDKIEQRLLEIRENREEDIKCILGMGVPYYDSDDWSMDLNKSEEMIQDVYGVDVEIERMIYYDFGVERYFIYEFKTVSDAKEFAKAYRESYDNWCLSAGHADEAKRKKRERIFEIITGEYKGHLTNLFMCCNTAERRGKIVVCGNIRVVEFIMDNVVD